MKTLETRQKAQDVLYHGQPEAERIRILSLGHVGGMQNNTAELVKNCLTRDSDNPPDNSWLQSYIENVLAREKLRYRGRRLCGLENDGISVRGSFVDVVCASADTAQSLKGECRNQAIQNAMVMGSVPNTDLQRLHIPGAFFDSVWGTEGLVCIRKFPNGDMPVRGYNFRDAAMLIEIDPDESDVVRFEGSDGTLRQDLHYDWDGNRRDEKDFMELLKFREKRTEWRWPYEIEPPAALLRELEKFTP